MTSSPSLFPLAAFDVIGNELADDALREWGHWLGGCNRPFGRQSFGLFVAPYGLVSVAVSASTVNATCGGVPRQQTVELARLASHPERAWATRLALRLWREVGAPMWPYWPTTSYVSYANNRRHTGDIYRFDGWAKVAETRAGTTGKNAGWSKAKAIEAKSVWMWCLPGATCPVRPVPAEVAT